jgi:hypothetical protein
MARESICHGLCSAWVGLSLPAALVAIGPLPAQAASRITLTVEEASFPGGSAAGLGLEMVPGGGPLVASAGRVRLDGAPTGRVESLELRCERLRLDDRQLRCDAGRLRGHLGHAGPQDTPLTLALDVTAPRLMARAGRARIANGSAVVSATLEPGRWRVEGSLEPVEAALLADLARPWLPLPEGFTTSGRIGFAGHAEGAGARLGDAAATALLAGLGFATADGTLAAEQLDGEVEISVGREERGVREARARLALARGQAYAEPVFLDFGTAALTAEAEGTLATGFTRLVMRSYRVEHAGIGRVTGSGEVDLAGATPLKRLDADIESVDLARAIPAYVRPLLLASAFKDLEGMGTLRGSATIVAGLPSQFDLTLTDVTLDSPAGALSVEGLAGRIRWYDDTTRSALAASDPGAEFASDLHWQGGRLWGLELGATVLPFVTAGRHFRLLEPVVIPVFDGGLAIDTLRVRHAGTPEMYVRFDAELRPVSLARISRALGWPEFGGTVSGRVPKLELQRGEVTVGGNLEARMFDGRVALRNLRLRDPLGKFPRLYGDVDIDELDLFQVTNTFSFGSITGRLSGRIAGLEMFDWMPVAFDGRLYTTPGDRSKHVISQRAVANLSSIGGGSSGTVTAALQGGFLRFFKTFRYDRLGLSCVLANDVCSMDGVATAPGGYYIVKGSGLPRVDVIGNQRRVAWTRLVRQLGSITSADVVVQ